MDEQERPAEDRADLEARYQAALAEYREWDRRATEAQSCDIAVATQRSLEVVRRLEARRARSSPSVGTGSPSLPSGSVDQ